MGHIQCIHALHCNLTTSAHSTTAFLMINLTRDFKSLAVEGPVSTLIPHGCYPVTAQILMYISSLAEPGMTVDDILESGVGSWPEGTPALVAAVFGKTPPFRCLCLAIRPVWVPPSMPVLRFCSGNGDSA